MRLFFPFTMNDSTLNTQAPHISCVLLTCSAELDDLAPLRDCIVPVGLFGCSLDCHCVLGARTQEPVAPNRHGQRHCLGHQLGRNVLDGVQDGRARTDRNESLCAQMQSVVILNSSLIACRQGRPIDSHITSEITRTRCLQRKGSAQLYG